MAEIIEEHSVIEETPHENFEQEIFTLNSIIDYLIASIPSENNIRILLNAIENNDISTVKIMIKHNVHLQKVDNNELNPLAVAIKHNAKEIIEMLIEAGCKTETVVIPDEMMEFVDSLQ